MPEPSAAAELSAGMEALLTQAGYRGPFTARSLSGGKNNRVYRVDTADGPVVLKSYFHHALDQRDRLGAEWVFTRFAWDRGVRCLPRPIARSVEERAALYDYVDGRRLASGAVEWPHVEQALRFVEELQQHARHPSAENLPAGSEACFSLADHLACVDRRVTRLRHAAEAAAELQSLRAFVEGELAPGWQEVCEGALRGASRHRLAVNEELSRANRCVSPSDFGYHNALETPSGELRFLDFEYAGWDDPAKLVGDFFCQPAVPVPGQWFEQFAGQVAAQFPKAESHRARMALLLPVYRVKWCCIVLNHFLREGAERRRFAGGERTVEEEQSRQIALARQCLEQVAGTPAV